MAASANKWGGILGEQWEELRLLCIFPMGSAQALFQQRL